MNQKLKLPLLCLIAGLIGAGCSNDSNVTNSTADSTEQEVLNKVPSSEFFEADILNEVLGKNGSSAVLNDMEDVIYITEPTVITQSGVYRVMADFSTDGDAIVIRADEVILFAGNKTISGPGNKIGRGIVIENASNVHVSGGRLVNFGIGVQATNVSKSSIRGVEVVGGDEFADPPNGVPPQIGVLLINSNANRIFWNQASNVNLGIFVRGGGSYNNKISNNRITGNMNGLLAVCYNPAPEAGPEGPFDDEIFRNLFSGFGVGLQFSAGSHNSRIRQNTIEYKVAPYQDFNGTNEFTGNRTTQL